MLARTLSRITALVPSSIKYRLERYKGSYNKLLSLAQPEVVIQTKGGQLRWQTNALTSQQFLLGTYEPYMQEAFFLYVREGDIVYDVGAHGGFHTLVAGLLAGSGGQVIAFEPNPQNIKLLQRQLELNPEINAHALPYALSDHCHVTGFDVSLSSRQGHLSAGCETTVEARTIDSLVESGECPAPCVIKIDVEGHEEQVVRGAMATIRQHRPTVLCDYNDGMTLALLSDLLKSVDYSVFHGPPVVALPRENIVRRKEL